MSTNEQKETTMMNQSSTRETFEEFKDSFSYGSRSDLNAKFLKNLTPDEAADFIQGLLWKLGDTIDDGHVERLVDHLYEWQIRGYTGEPQWEYDQGPFASLRKPVSGSRLVLLTSSGHFVAGDDPEPLGVENLSEEEAIERIVDFMRTEPTLSPVPADTPVESLRVRHPGYDVRGARTDPNVVFPLEHLRDLEREGIIGELAPSAYSFVGTCSQRLLLGEAGPQWAWSLGRQGIDVALLVPV
jgi:hypothetical protein